MNIDHLVTETLNDCAKEKGFKSWLQMRITIDYKVANFVEHAVRTALGKINFQMRLE